MLRRSDYPVMIQLAAPRWALPVLLSVAMAETFGIALEFALRVSVSTVGA
jgi:hypothetical protein